jgi:hypothetical protein
LGIRAGIYLVAALVGVEFAGALTPFCALPFGEAKVDENAAVLLWVVEEVCGFDVTVKNAACVDGLEAGEETPEVHAHVADGHVAEVVSKIVMLEVGQDGNDLVLVAEGSNERAYRVRTAEVVKEFEFVEDAYRTAGDVYLFDSDIL